MPRIDDSSIELKRPFKKKAYRPWNLMEDEYVLDPHSKILNDSDETLLVTNKESISNHIGINKESNSNHLVNKFAEKVTKSEPIGNPISNQISNQIIDFTPSHFNTCELIKRVTGIQKKILFHIVEDCILNGNLASSPISTVSLVQLTNTDKNTVKTATQRLINKKLISRGHGKKGKGGFQIFTITEDIRNAVIDAQKHLIHPNGLVTNWLSNKEPLSTYSSSSNNNIKINTTTALPDDWKKINYELLTHIGFSETQLRQLYESNTTTPEIVQDALNRFAYSLEHNDKVKAYAEPLNVLMGVLRKGQRWNEANYVSPKELALRQMLEEKRKQKVEFDTMISELIELEFPEWKRKLSSDEIIRIVPEDVRKTNLAAAIHATLRSYFKENVLLPRLETLI